MNSEILRCPICNFMCRPWNVTCGIMLKLMFQVSFNLVITYPYYIGFSLLKFLYC